MHNGTKRRTHFAMHAEPHPSFLPFRITYLQLRITKLVQIMPARIIMTAEQKDSYKPIEEKKKERKEEDKNVDV